MKYIITPSPYLYRHSGMLLLNDLDQRQKQQLQGHLRAQDYFGTLATVLSLMKQNNEEILSGMDKHVVDEAVEELSFLQDNYRIEQV